MRRSASGAATAAAFVVTVAITLATAACTPTAKGVSSLPPPSTVLVLTPAEELFDLSPARVHIQRLVPQAVRLLAPHWTQVQESARKTLQVTLMGILAEERVEPFVRVRLEEAVAAQPELAAETIGWLRGPLGYEVKFAEATASTREKASDAAFYSSVADIRANRLPDIRLEPLRRLAKETDALATMLDQTESVGTVVARLVNLTKNDKTPLSVSALDQVVERERREPAVADAYEAVVLAALLVRCRELDVADLDRYIEFASTDAGRWYHQVMASSLVSAVNSASIDVEGVFAANGLTAAGSSAPPPDSMLVPLPSGGEVRLLALAQAGPESDPAVVLRYETALSMSNSGAVTSEAKEVWETVRPQIEPGGAKKVVLQPTGSVVGWVFPFASSRKFGWRLGDSGQWSPLENGAAGLGGLQREVLWSAPF